MKYYMTNEVSIFKSLKIKNIQNLIRDKKIIAFRVGKRHRIAHNDLKLFILVSGLC